MIYQRLVFPALSQFDPEIVHERTLGGIKLATRSSTFLQLVHKLFSYEHPSLKTQVLGLDFNNPLGIAAGFDKNGNAFPFLSALGFSHVDNGTVVPLTQPGNPKVRMFRLVSDRALINRLGFNSQGRERIKRNLRNSYQCWITPGFNLGLNIGANKVSVDTGKAFDDYVLLAGDEELIKYADFITINVSSPNTAKLRDLQGKEALTFLLDSVLAAIAKSGFVIPVVVKIAPDLKPEEIDTILEVIFGKAAGIVATNTTIARPMSLRGKFREETGGLSGKPLFDPSTDIVRYIYRHTEGQLPIIGVGGVFDWSDVVYKMLNGASLVQTYTGFIYQGPTMSKAINRGLVRYMQKEGVKEIGDLVGRSV